MAGVIGFQHIIPIQTDFSYDLGMDKHDERKEEVRLLLNKAVDSGYTLKTIAEGAKVKYASVRSFASNGKIGPANLTKIDLWLKANGISESPNIEDMDELDEIFKLIVAAELKSCISTIESSRVSTDTKLSKLMFFADSTQSLLARFWESRKDLRENKN